MDRPPLPEPFDSELTRLLDGPDDEFWPGVARLCQQHPDRTKEIRRLAEAIDATRRDGKTRTDAASGVVAAADVQPGDRIGAFSILAEIGHGGMGSVYLAEQKEPVRRRVALKVIKLGMDTRAVLARFEAERQALALMDHPHIAKVFEAGVTPQGRPYFAMEYVKGIPITRYCDEHKLSLDERLLLFKQLCSGVQHAHGKGVIHRDLTPSNVLVMLQDGNPSAKIIDFGLARATDHRLTEKTVFTEQGVILGTPEYMSPEQAGLNALDVDTRSDVYTLGVVLYELLTGKLPFDSTQLRAAGYDAMCKTIREQDPPRPSTKVTTAQGGTAAAAKVRRTDAGTLLRRLRGDLDWIVLKCLEKNRTRRYETVNELAADVQRHLDNEPVLARAPSGAYRLRKFIRRNPFFVTATAIVIVSSSVNALVRAVSLRSELASARQAWWSVQDRLTSLQTARTREFASQVWAREYERVIATEEQLHPAWPKNLDALRRWVHEDAARLLAIRPQIDQIVRDLRAEEHSPSQHLGVVERFLLRRKTAQLASLERAHSIRVGRQELTLPAATTEELSMGASQLKELAWERVDPDESRRIWGEEERALMLAKLAWERSARLSPKERTAVCVTLAWAWFANGKDGEAIAQFENALTLPNHGERQGYVNNLVKLRAEVLAASGEAGANALVRQRAAVAASDAEVWFAENSTRVLAAALTELLAHLESLARKEAPAVTERLVWARRIEALTFAHPNARTTWQQARDAIAKADGVVASELYRVHAMDLKPQMGLVPIGMNPVTKLWEFYELRSAWDGAGDPSEIEIPRHVEAGERAGYIEVRHGTGIVFVLLPGGTFTMGSQDQDPDAPNYDPDRQANEEVHRVSLAPFFMARHELTQGQWQRLGGASANADTMRASHPVETVDWEACVTLLAKHVLVLPSEAQWEFACRAGTRTPWLCAIVHMARHANLADATAKGAAVSWNCESWNDGHTVHAAVGSYLPNAFGLFDVHGNVWEWTMDGEHGGTAQPRHGDGLRGDPSSSDVRIYRGGSYRSLARFARSAFRGSNHTRFRCEYIGLRPARLVQP